LSRCEGKSGIAGGLTLLRPAFSTVALRRKQSAAVSTANRRYQRKRISFYCQGTSTAATSLACVAECCALALGERIPRSKLRLGPLNRFWGSGRTFQSGAVGTPRPTFALGNSVASEESSAQVGLAVPSAPRIATAVLDFTDKPRFTERSGSREWQKNGPSISLISPLA